jgi:hypothetical protein
MALRIVHDFMQTTQNGNVLNLYLSRSSNVSVEFAEELGHLTRTQEDRQIYSYIQEHYPQIPINQVRLVTGDGQVVTLSYMSMMADVRPRT